MRKLYCLLAGVLSVFGVNFVAVAQQAGEEAYLAYEVFSGRVLYAKNADKRMPMSGLSQIATAIVAIDWAKQNNIELDRRIPVPAVVAGLAGSNPLNLQIGESLTLRDALYSMLLGTDAASAISIAEFVGGDLALRRNLPNTAAQKEFVSEMILLARHLKMQKTTFRSAHGIEPADKVSMSSAIDIAMLGQYAMRNAAFAFIVKQPKRQVSVSGPAGARLVEIRSSNTLLGSLGVDGVKTSTTQAAGRCALIQATRNSLVRKDASGQELIYPQRLAVVVMNANDRMTLVNDLLKNSWGEYDRWFQAGLPRQQNDDYIQIPN